MRGDNTNNGNLIAITTFSLALCSKDFKAKKPTMTHSL